MPTLTPQQFVDKWERAELKERASYQEHFMDVCHLVGHPTPAEHDPTGESFCFEAGVKTTTGGQGYADVWYKGHFAIEYKGKGQYDTLDAAYQQLLKYRENLGNPPLLIVTDIERWEIHTNFTGTEKRVYAFTSRDIANLVLTVFETYGYSLPKDAADRVAQLEAEIDKRVAALYSSEASV